MRPLRLYLPVLEAIRHHDGEVTSQWIARTVGLTRQQARNAIRIFRAKGELEKTARGTYRATTHAGAA